MSGPRYAVIPAAAATDAHIKPRDLQLLCVLGRHTDDLGWCRRSQVKMASEMGCSRGTVFNAIERLIKRGYLERHIVESESGRDSAHLYRVVLDPVLDDFSTVQPEETTGENDVDPPCQYTGTPANLLAPPASPELAPPASPGLAPSITSPSNDPLLTEREGARDPQEDPCPETGHGKPVGRSTWVARLKRVHATWPTFATDSSPKAEKIWFCLSEVERQSAIDGVPGYLTLQEKHGRKAQVAFTTYLSEKRWEKLTATAAETASPCELQHPSENSGVRCGLPNCAGRQGPSATN